MAPTERESASAEASGKQFERGTRSGPDGADNLDSDMTETRASASGKQFARGTDSAKGTDGPTDTDSDDSA